MKEECLRCMWRFHKYKEHYCVECHIMAKVAGKTKEVDKREKNCMDKHTTADPKSFACRYIDRIC